MNNRPIQYKNQWRDIAVVWPDKEIVIILLWQTENDTRSNARTKKIMQKIKPQKPNKREKIVTWMAEKPKNKFERYVLHTEERIVKKTEK